MEKPNKAMAVKSTEIAVILPVPKRRFNFSLFKLERIVPPQIIIKTVPE